MRSPSLRHTRMQGRGRCRHRAGRPTRNRQQDAALAGQHALGEQEVQLQHPRGRGERGRRRGRPLPQGGCAGVCCLGLGGVGRGVSPAQQAIGGWNVGVACMLCGLQTHSQEDRPSTVPTRPLQGLRLGPPPLAPPPPAGGSAVRRRHACGLGVRRKQPAAGPSLTLLACASDRALLILPRTPLLGVHACNLHGLTLRILPCLVPWRSATPPSSARCRARRTTPLPRWRARPPPPARRPVARAPLRTPLASWPWGLVWVAARARARRALCRRPVPEV